MTQAINNQIYNELGERWYNAFDDPVALLRAEARLIGPWIIDTARKRMSRTPVDAIDLGCGGGFISNQLAQSGLKTIGFDLSESSLAIAQKYDRTSSVEYRIGDVTKVPMHDECCDIVTCCDVIEHIESPQKMVHEAYRLLKPGGMFFFHTFSRNVLAYIVVIKLVEWFVRNTPEHLHVLSLFVNANEVKKWTTDAGFTHFETIGIRPSFTSMMNKSVLRRIVPESMKFKFTKNEWISYAGFAVKP